MYFVYILKSIVDKSYYIGFTIDVIKRLREHNKGKNYSTKLKKPWLLIHVEIVNSRIEARDLEKYFKSGYGREIIKEIDGYLTN